MIAIVKVKDKLQNMNYCVVILLTWETLLSYKMKLIEFITYHVNPLYQNGVWKPCNNSFSVF